jgi:hypothetical protein
MPDSQVKLCFGPLRCLSFTETELNHAYGIRRNGTNLNSLSLKKEEWNLLRVSCEIMNLRGVSPACMYGDGVRPPLPN